MKEQNELLETYKDWWEEVRSHYNGNPDWNPKWGNKGNHYRNLCCIKNNEYIIECFWQLKAKIDDQKKQIEEAKKLNYEAMNSLYTVEKLLHRRIEIRDEKIKKLEKANERELIIDTKKIMEEVKGEKRG